MSRNFPNILAKAAVLTPVEDQEEPQADKHGPASGSRPKFFRRHVIMAAALALLILGAATIRLGGDYWASKNIIAANTILTANLPARSIAGFNTTVPAAEFKDRLKAVTHQRVTLTVGTMTTLVDSDTIKSWLQITANKQKTEYYIHTNQAAISASLAKLAGQYVQAPVDKVTVNEDGRNVVVVNGSNGTSLSDPGTLKTQAGQLAKSVLDGKGMKFSTPIATKPFRAVGPSAFDKVLVANITSKKMWAFENGKQVNSFLVSAGKPTTPTPLGEFHVYAKFTAQDMSGYNPDGTPYFQPQVPWVSYFYEGSAVHGVYWHPLSWFGAINSSHGCVGLPVDQSEWVFNWAPIGTTVITHA